METERGPRSYLTLEPGAEVTDRFGCLVGELERVIVHDGGTFDGLVVQTAEGTRFVDAPEVRRITPDDVTLGVAVEDVLNPAGVTQRVYGIVAAGHEDRTLATEADRDAVIERLKQAYVEDTLSTEGLEQRVVVAHKARSLDDLDEAVADL